MHSGLSDTTRAPNVFVWLCLPHLQEGTSADEELYVFDIADDGSVISEAEIYPVIELERMLVEITS